MINYLLEFSIYWLILLMGYEVLLSKLPKFHLNRVLLWASLIFSALLPLIPPVNMVQSAALPSIQLPSIWVEGQNTIHAANEATSSFPFIPWLLGIVAVILAVRLTHGIIQISLLKGRSNRSSWGGYQLYTSAAIKEPFSFWSSVYLPQYHSFNREEMEHILHHETGHIRHRHSLDNIIMEIMQCILWWNPLFYFFRKKLHEIHEYQADLVVTSAGDWQPYGRFLVNHGVSFSHIPLAQTIFAHPLKKRIKMLKKNQNQKNYSRYYWSILPILALCVLLHACSEKESLDSEQDAIEKAEKQTPESYTQSDTIVTFDPNTGKEEVKVVSKTEDYYVEVDEKPRFPGCEEKNLTGDALDECSTKEFLNWIYTRVKYPKEAKEAGAEGMALVKFIVTKDGYIDRIRLAKDPGSGMGDAAMATTRQMVSEQIQWRPGIKDGSPVNVEFTLPIRFKLQ